MGDRDSGSDAPAHTPGTRRGEEIKEDDGQEAGRMTTGASHTSRPSGTRTARDATSINPENEEPIDPRSPRIPPA